MTDKIEYPRDVFARAFDKMNSEFSVAKHLELIEKVFFASMMPEEGELVPLGLVVDDGNLEEKTDSSHDGDEDNRAWIVLRMDPMPLTSRDLKRLAHGTEYGRDLVVVGLHEKEWAMTGIARRRPVTDGGDALRIAAPRPGVLVLEGLNRQLGVRYEVGLEAPRDVEVLMEKGPVLDALQASRMVNHRWWLSEILRHARAAKCGAMFLCLPSADGTALPGKAAYRFSDKAFMAKQEAEGRNLVFRSVAGARIKGEPNRDQLRQQALLDAETAVVRERSTAAVEIIGRLAANDGAIVIEPGFNISAGGFIIDITSGGAKTEPPQPKLCHDAAGTNVVERPKGGGARHAAGFKFAWANPGAVVFIVSADGPVTCALRVGEDILTWSVRLPET